MMDVPSEELKILLDIDVVGAIMAYVTVVV